MARHDARFGNLDAEFFFDTEHEADHVEGAEPRLPQVVLRTDDARHGVIDEQTLNDAGDSTLDGRRPRRLDTEIRERGWQGWEGWMS